MNCKSCDDAAAGPSHGFHSGCLGCMARAASRSPAYRRVSKLGRLDADYLALLKRLGVTHAQAKEAAQVDAMGVR